MFNIFCTNCSAYIPSGTFCPHCGARRAAIHISPAPGKPVWQVSVPGSVSTQITSVTLPGKEEGLIVPWAVNPRRENNHTSDGGVSLLHCDDGHTLWTQHVGTPIEGGAAVNVDEGSVVAGAGARSPGAGEGYLFAFDLSTGEVHWRTRLGGAVRCAPVLDGARIFAAASDGAVYCLEAPTGQVLWRTSVCPEGTPIPASPLVIKDRDFIQAIVVGTYGGPQGREEGKLIAFDERGRKMWEQKAGGNVRGAPVLVQDTLYVSSFRNVPSAGLLNAFEARTGKPAWDQPFRVQGQPSDRKSYNFSSAPLVTSSTIYIGSLNGQMFALYASTGKLMWDSKRNIGGAIGTTPATAETLLIFGANDGSVYAVDATSGERVWDYSLGAPVLTSPVVKDGVAYAGADSGVVTALAWHNGLYAWAADYLERTSRLAEAGDCRALSAHFSFQHEVQARDYQNAANDWGYAGVPNKAAEMWVALGHDDQAAVAYAAAGERWRMHQPELAAQYYKKAAFLHSKLRQREALNQCTRAMAICSHLPYVLLQAVNVGSFIQWEEGEFTLRLLNEGVAPVAGGVRLWMGGALKSAQQAFIQSPLLPGQMWNIPLQITPTRRDSTLEVEIEYDSGMPNFGVLHGMLAIQIDAVEPPKKPIQIGDVGMLRLTIAGTTAEGLEIVTHDVGALRSEGSIGAVKAEGDIGSVNAGNVIDGVTIKGDAGIVHLSNTGA